MLGRVIRRAVWIGASLGLALAGTARAQAHQPRAKDGGPGGVLLGCLVVPGCTGNDAGRGQAPAALTPAEARQIAREAFVYGFPLATNYETLYKQAVDTANRDYRAPFNVIASASDVATPDDKFVVTPNSDPLPTARSTRSCASTCPRPRS